MAVHASGHYTPACANEWLAGVCEKPRIKCGECNNRLLIPLTDTVVYEHLAGKRTVGVYPLLSDHSIGCELVDERYAGSPLDVAFAGTLRPDQEVAVAAMLQHDAGVLCAPTAFGKTVTAPAMIAPRGVNTLVLVHRTELLKQWQERLQSFLGVGQGVVGTIGGGKAKPTGKIDIAVMPSCRRSILRCDFEAGQSHIRTRADCHTDSPRRSAADYFHAMRANSPHSSQARRCAARSGGHAAHAALADRFAAAGRDSGCIPAPRD